MAFISCFYTFIQFPSQSNTYIIEMFGCFHNEGSSLILVVLHPALTKKLPVETSFHKKE